MSRPRTVITADKEIVDFCRKNPRTSARARVMVPYQIWVKWGRHLSCSPPLITSIKDIHRDRSCKKRCVVARLCNVGVCCYPLKQLASRRIIGTANGRALTAHKQQNGYDSDAPFSNWVRSHHACTCWRLNDFSTDVYDYLISCKVNVS